MTDARRVAVTGIGLISALGSTRDAVWASMVAGSCGIGDITQFDGANYRSRQAAEIRDCPRLPGLSDQESRRLSKSDRTALVATAEALADSDARDSVTPDRIGVIFGSGTADLLRNEHWFAAYERGGWRAAPPRGIYNHFPGTPSDVVATHFGCEGLKASVLSACSSSTVAIGYAADAIRAGQADVMIAGASDMLCQITFSGFNALRLVDEEPCRPFCRTRKGMNIGEAAAVLVLEELARARRRGAKIYAEVRGYGARCEAYHPTSPEPDGHAVAALIEDACRASRIAKDDIDHINAHGTATPQNDRAEARGFQRVFGDRAGMIPVTSIKSMVGHCLAAAGAIEAAALALTISTGVIPPTINFRESDPECPLDIVANEARETRVSCAVSTSLAFGGNDAAVVMRRVS